MDSKDRLERWRPSRRAWVPYAIVAAIAVVLGAIAFWLAHTTPPPQTGRGRFRGGGPGAGALAMPVGVAKAERGDISIVLNALGTVTPLRVVTVSAQVAGQLQKVNFAEGQMVAAGDLLADIDPRTFQAALAQAEGTYARDQALLANAKIDLARYQTLFQQDSIAKQQLDAQASLVRQYEGTLKSDQGQIESAKVNLAYTKIAAPLAGRVGLRQVDPGNNVQNGGAIVVITQLQPIDVLFTVPEDNLQAILAKRHAGVELAVELYDRSGQNKIATGALASLDNQIDTSTGTVKAKAEFANAEETLFPNQFVNVRVLLDVMHDALVIPTSSLERGSGGLFVYVVQPDRTVKVQNIKTGPTEGERVAVTEGLNVGDTVVTSGADRLREGSRVELPGEEPPAAAKANASGDDGKRQWKRGEGQQGQRRGDGQRRRDGGGNPQSGARGSKPEGAKPTNSEPKPSDGG
jgi:multidrug efflux system membrane fusion protein